MFHIVFSGDENYLKYTAVCIASIVKNTNTSKVFADFLNTADRVIDEQIDEQEEYHFHILTDYVSKDTENKLSQLATELSVIFPTQIHTHTFGNEEFLGQPPWRNNYLTYYRIKIDKILPSHIGKALYLDGDMLVNCDIRELFAVNVDNVICATVANVSPMGYILQGRFDKSQYVFPGNTYYFNAGMMLINLIQWRVLDIETKVFAFLRKYITKAPDQDALNAVINQNLVKLPYKWNMMIHKYRPPSETINIGESGRCNSQHTKADYLEGIENPKIIHYGLKPWNGGGFSVTAAYKPYHYDNFDLWWNMVEETPVFKEELKAIKESASYKRKIAKEEKKERMLALGNSSFAFLWFKFKRESRPYMKKLEAPFKKIRNKIRAKKIKNI